MQNKLLKKIRYKGRARQRGYPFEFGWLNDLKDFSFQKNVTILVGENGSGKSTLLESIGIQADAILLSGATFDHNSEYNETTKLARQLTLQWSAKTRSGFYFRADDFISYIRGTRHKRQEAREALAEIEDPHSLARMPHMRTLAELDHLYSTDLEKLSHGQAFLELFTSRLRPHSLYFLDEPESPLTPQNQLALVRMIYEAEQQGSQFIISTHSPIIMAYPNADIIEIREDELKSVSYDEIEHMSFLQNFLESPQHYIHYVTQDD